MKPMFFINYKIVLTCDFADVGTLTVIGPKTCKDSLHRHILFEV